MAVTYDGTTIRLYVNGTMVGSQAKTGAITSSTNQLQIGGDRLYGQYFSGPDRRDPDLQHGPLGCRHPDRHDHARFGELDDRYDAAVDSHRVDDKRS